MPRCFSIFLKTPIKRCLLAIAFTALAAAAHATDVYTVVVQDIDYFPIYRADPTTESYSGYVRELMDTFARHQGIHFKYKVRPVRRMTMEYLNNRYDFALPDNPQWDQAAKEGHTLHYSEPLLTFTDAVFVPDGKQHMTINDMADYGTIYGFTPWKFQAMIDSGEVELKTASRPANLIRMAMAGRVTAFNLAVPVAQYHFLRLGARGRFQPAPGLMPHAESHYHLSTLKHPGLIKAFDRFLLEHQDEVNALLTQYGLK